MVVLLLFIYEENALADTAVLQMPIIPVRRKPVL